MVDPFGWERSHEGARTRYVDEATNVNPRPRSSGAHACSAPAEGAFYAFVKVAGDDMEVASRWLDKGHVAATPGSAFYAPGWIRLSYAASMEKLKEAMSRIKRVG